MAVPPFPLSVYGSLQMDDKPQAENCRGTKGLYPAQALLKGIFGCVHCCLQKTIPDLAAEDNGVYAPDRYIGWWEDSGSQPMRGYRC
jgi:hypothetical protein